MIYYPTPKQNKYDSASKPSTQKELIEQMNKNTKSTCKYTELLFWQLDPITNQFRKEQQNGK